MEDEYLPIGTVLQGRYRIDAAVARGRTGNIYRATDLQARAHDGAIAVKEMLEQFPDPVQHEKAVQQFRAEFQTLSALEHPCLPKVWAYFEDTGRHYLVMDYLDATNLEDILQSTESLPPEPVVMGWLTQMLDVLDYLHSRNPPVIFRDLRPPNVMVTPNGRLMLVDFGIAKMMMGGPGGRTLFRAVGSPEFAPPEQFGMSRSDARTDIYALGATLYYLLSKSLPPQAADRVIRNAPLTDLATVNPTVSPETQVAIARMMAVKPSERFGSVAEIREFLAGPLSRAVMSAPPPRLKAPAPAAAQPAPAPYNVGAQVMSQDPNENKPPQGFQVPATRMMGNIPPSGEPAASPEAHPPAAPPAGGFQVPATRMMNTPPPGAPPPAEPKPPAGGFQVPATRMMGSAPTPPAEPAAPGAPPAGGFQVPATRMMSNTPPQNTGAQAPPPVFQVPATRINTDDPWAGAPMAAPSAPAAPAEPNPWAGPPMQSTPAPTPTPQSKTPTPTPTPTSGGGPNALLIVFIVALMAFIGVAVYAFIIQPRVQQTPAPASTYRPAVVRTVAWTPTPMQHMS